ncbi:hypothetical protein QYM36_008518 [Artemia franciscana]|nr:hypothetical protein QYM36_008518 [Artemia franciscana]KAK2728066.1 hypothetical protein QYM36_008518 [Artemia franciscana]KAK2728067.1 hypothetical protein QYM36_008518 [Artemia franciscana]
MGRGYCLKWNRYSTVFQSSFSNLFASQELTDMTFVVEGKLIKSHRIIMSAASGYFRKLLIDLKESNPVIVLNDVSYNTFKALIDFIYCGEIEVHQSFLEAIVDVGEKFRVQGLCKFDEGESNDLLSEVTTRASEEPEPKKSRLSNGLNLNIIERRKNDDVSQLGLEVLHGDGEERQSFSGCSFQDIVTNIKGTKQINILNEDPIIPKCEIDHGLTDNSDLHSSEHSQVTLIPQDICEEDLQETNSIEENLPLKIGDKFSSLEGLYFAIKQYSRFTGIRLVKRDSRTLTTAQATRKRAFNASEKLVYYFIEYVCDRRTRVKAAMQSPCST